jgi:hypothetical protein
MASDVIESTEVIAADDPYEPFLASLRKRFERTTKGEARLVTTDARGLFDLYLAALPEGLRQEYSCSKCRKFVERYGGLVTISAEGVLASVLWGLRRRRPCCMALCAP